MFRTKRLTLERSLKLLQLEYGTQVKEIKKENNKYYANEICGSIRKFTREEILEIENNIYGAFGA